MSYRHRIENPSVVKFNGTKEAAIAFGNGLNLLVAKGILKDFTFDKMQGRKDGEVDQIFRLQLQEATNYDTRTEAPYVDKSGDLYVFQSQLEADKVKVGISIHVPVRVQQVSRKFEESFKRIHSVHCTNAKERETWVHNYLREHGAVDLGHEMFRVKDWHLDWLRSLSNE